MAYNWKGAQITALEKQGNLLVSASAGSGKTTVMVERILRYLENGGDIRRIVVITFTKAGAAEMKEKLVEGLYKRIREGGSGVPHLAEQIKNVNFSYISTIDSFCSEIYRQYFEDIGGDSVFGVLEGAEAQYLFGLATDEVFTEYLENKDAEFIELAGRFTEKRDLRSLKEAVRNINDFMAVQANPEEFLEKAKNIAGMPPENTPAYRYLLSRYLKQVSYFYAECESALERYYFYKDQADIFIGGYEEYLQDIFQKLAELKTADGIKTFTERITDTEFLKLPAAKRNIPEEIAVLKDSLKSFIDGVKGFYKKLREELIPDCLPGAGPYQILDEKERVARRYNKKLLETAVRVRERYQELKKAENKLDFSDLEHNALRILLNDSRAEEFKQNIDFIFLDEYQDTNYLQEAVIARIAKDNVFMVGDVKQSIYKFRFAEPKIFLDKRESYVNYRGGQNVDLNDNFRSSKEILEFINMVFDEVMTYDFGGVDYRRDANLQPGIEYETDKRLQAVRIKFFPKNKEAEEDQPPVYRVKDAKIKKPAVSFEALYIANRIKDIVGKIKIFDAKTQKMRLARYGDIAILMRARAGAAIMEELRKRNIPYSAPDFGDAYGQDIELIISLLKVIDNYRNDIPLYAVMSSYFGGFSDAELARISKDGNGEYFWQAVAGYDGEPILKEKIDGFFKMLDGYRSLSCVTDTPALISKIIADTGYDGYLLSREEEYRIEYVNAFIYGLKDKDYAKTLQGFLNGYNSSGLPEINLAPKDGDAVAFYTIHKSKGLEFPIVFLAAASQGYLKMRSSKKNIMLDRELGLAAKLLNTEDKTRENTLSTLAFIHKEGEEEKEELARLMYVAVTRARYHLFITGEFDARRKEPSVKLRQRPGDAENFMEWIEFARSRNPKINGYFDPEDYGEEAVPEKKLPPERKHGKPLDLSFDYPYAGALNLSAKYTVTAINKEGYQEEYQNTAVLDDKAADKGTAYHKFLEICDFNRTSLEEILEDISRFTSEGIIENGEILDAGILHRILNSSLFDLARSGKVYREKTFLLYLPAKEILDAGSEEKVLVQGVIDLLITGKRNILVDYKYTNAPIETVKERYIKQVKIYAAAAERLMNIRLDERIIYIINSGAVINI